jgi:hypothetical protein
MIFWRACQNETDLIGPLPTGVGITLGRHFPSSKSSSRTRSSCTEEEKWPMCLRSSGEGTLSDLRRRSERIFRLGMKSNRLVV